MKRFWTLWILLCSTAVFLTACSTQTAEAVVPIAVQNTAVAPTPTTPLPATSSELSLIGQTGRPQLLNAYASW